MKLDHIKYAHGELTPRKNIADLEPGVNRMEIVDSQRFKRIEAVLKSSEGTFSDQTEAADEVGAMVRQTLLFGSMAIRERLWSYDERSDATVTNCLGFTIVSSELLEAIGVDHTISFCNGHSFITMFNPVTDEIQMMDTASKELYLNIDGAVSGLKPPHSLKDSKVSTNLLDTSTIIAQGGRRDATDFLYRHPWLRNGPGSMMMRSDVPRLGSTHILRTYLPGLGREVLNDYGMAEENLIGNQLYEAVGYFSKLEGVYPHLGAENKLGIATPLRDKLARAGLVEEMLKIGTVVDGSLLKDGPSPDRTTNIFFLLDTKRRIAHDNGDASSLFEIADQYEKIGGTLARAKAKKTRIYAQNLY